MADDTYEYPAVPTGFFDSEPPLGCAGQRLAVLGDPIQHSRSPQLQLAAYRALGLRWDYARWRIPAGELAASISRRGQGWRGFSVTAPLKAEALAFADSVSADARRSGAVNTLVFNSPEPQASAVGDNTDIPGIVAAFTDRGIDGISGVAHVLGAGETAASAVVAAQRLGSDRVEVYARRPERATELAQRLGPTVTAHSLETWRLRRDVRLLVDTIPRGYRPLAEVAAEPLADVALLTAAYDPWPTPLVEMWQRTNAPIVTGLDMLLHQAVFQVRLFVGGAIDTPLPNEPDVLTAMRTAMN